MTQAINFFSRASILPAFVTLGIQVFIFGIFLVINPTIDKVGLVIFVMALNILIFFLPVFYFLVRSINQHIRILENGEEGPPLKSLARICGATLGIVFSLTGYAIFLLIAYFQM